MIDTAIITAAGNGTRFLPATKNVPKEMLPLLDVPILHEVVKECIDAGITRIIIVTKRGNTAVEDYFDNNKELEDYLTSRGQLSRYSRFNEVFDQADIAYVRQHKNLPYGNGTPALTAKPFIPEGKPFAYLFGDDLILAKTSGIGQIIKRYEELSQTDNNLGGTILFEDVPADTVNRYGMLKYKDEAKSIMDTIIEKPPVGQSPSLHATFGRYVLSYDIFSHLSVEAVGKDNELWMVDAITKLAQEKNIYAAPIVDGHWYTTSDPAHMFRTTLAYALSREDLKDDILEILKEGIENLPNQG